MAVVDDIRVIERHFIVMTLLLQLFSVGYLLHLLGGGEVREHGDIDECGQHRVAIDRSTHGLWGTNTLKKHINIK